MRRFLVRLFTSLMPFSFVSCGDNPDRPDSSDNSVIPAVNLGDDPAGKNMGIGLYDDSKFINGDCVTYYCNTNEDLFNSETEIKGILVEFPGLGGSSCIGGRINMGQYVSELTTRCAENGIVVAYMFPGPWSWGNRAAVRMTDSVVTALKDKYSLPDDFSLVVCGGSMGGLGALNYAADTAYRNNLEGVVAACPCIDVLDRFAAAPSYPRTFVSAVASYDMPLTEALKSISPAHRIAEMPDVPYFICSDGADEVFPEAQCDKYVDALKARDLNVIYYQQPGLKHGEFTEQIKGSLHDFIVQKALAGRGKV